MEIKTLPSKEWLIKYQPRWWQWRLRKKDLWIKETLVIPEYTGISVKMIDRCPECGDVITDIDGEYWLHDDEQSTCFFGAGS